MSDITLSKAVRTNLLSLQSTADLMARTQERLATGKKVNSALDNPTNFFTSSSLNSRAADLNALMDNMSNGVRTLEAADNGLTSITRALESMQSTLRQARQDKSFQIDTYEVNKASTLVVSGGRFADDTEIRLKEPTGGIKPTLTSVPGIDFTNPPAQEINQGPAPRTSLEYHSSFGSGDKLRIDDQEITLGALATADAAGLAGAITTALNTNSITGYTVTANGNKVLIEAADKTGKAPKIDFVTGIDTATFGETSFIYDANNVGPITVSGQMIPTTTANFASFVASLEAKAEAGDYEVITDPATQRITLRTKIQGGPAPTIVGLHESTAATGASQNYTINLANPWTNPTALFGVDFTTAPNDIAALASALNNATSFNGDYLAEAVGQELKITTKAVGANLGAGTIETHFSSETRATIVPNTAAAGHDAVTNGITVTRNDGTAGTYTEEIAAASYKFKLTYDTRQVDINIIGRDSGLNSVANQLKRINDQLLAAGIPDIEASFNEDDQLVFTSRISEKKMLALSNGDAHDLFGPNGTAIGAAAVSAYKSSNPVDQFVEEINRNPDTMNRIRASNDNGKLRIENLSTQQLNVILDKDGDGVGSPTPHKIAGNSVRTNLATEYNELKNQLDRFADDASFNGINLLRGDNLRITFNESGNSFIEIQSKDGAGISANTLDLRQLHAIDLDNDDDIDALLAEIKNALSAVRSQASKFGSNLSIVQNRQDFTKNMINTLQTGAANLTLADMNEEAANLLALQTRQSLSSSSLSLASQADQSVLQLLQ